MQHDNASFWTDIKDFEERLSQAPDSYIFARLSEVYLKVGLVDDALYIARQGVAKYPGYAAGQRSLALACHAKGLLEESRQALEVVTTALPDDREAQKLLGRLLSMNGDNNAAFRAFSTVLEFYPDDVECKVELDALEQSPSISLSKDSQDNIARIDLDEAVFGESSVIEEEIDETEEIIEDAEILEMDEADFIEDDTPAVVSVTKPHDPLSTVTLANLYVQQGFIDKALDIYRVILADDPNNFDVLSRIAKLENRENIGIETPPESVYGEDLAVGSVYQENTSTVLFPPAQGKADNAVSVLEGWLDNVRRMKACR
ncbi:MAG: hypothetical protein A2X79_04055 [Desulfuromonadaceae bacterium GWB2_53_15]|nr:MAG: hypothetical protein A2X79_04055 [Desulfuromonadaceae bacterium GWB2_53_15]